jgi:MoaA/NifB/PqqE/SkfB family radical SAM enzyme
MHPNFIELCQKLSKGQHLSLNTNLSSNLVYDFANKVNPKKVEFIHCSLHITERNRMDSKKEFAKKVNYLVNKGFTAYVSQVMWPPLLEKFDNLFNFFADRGIMVKPKAFRGRYRWRSYPGAYTQQQKKKILDYMDLIQRKELMIATKDHQDPCIDRYFLDGKVSFSGYLCYAGMKSVFIDFDGTVYRCHSEKTVLGNIFKDTVNLSKIAKPCIANICQCPYYGFRFAEGKPKIIARKVFKINRNI